MLSIVADGDEFDVSSFSSLEGIVTMFKDSSNVFAGWIHYLAFDALVGRWIVMDLTKRGASKQFHFAVVIPWETRENAQLHESALCDHTH